MLEFLKSNKDETLSTDCRNNFNNAIRKLSAVTHSPASHSGSKDIQTSNMTKAN